MLDIRPDWYLFSHEEVVKNLANETTEVGKKPDHGKEPTILVVDDQHMIADTTALVLNRSGFHAIRAYSGQSALDIALQIQPHYLLTDIMMPGMNGVELAIAVHSELPATQIVLISGQAGIVDILQDAKEQGHEFDLLAKPTPPEKLVRHLKGKSPHLWK